MRPAFRGAQRASVPLKLLSKPLALEDKISKKMVEMYKQRRREISR